MKQWKSPIPTNVHLIWIGDNPMPDFMELFLITFRKYMPEFNIKVWNDNDLNRTNFPKTYNYILKSKKVHGSHIEDEDGYKMYDKQMNPIVHSKFAQITDLMRLEILYNHGGYYFDVNFELLKPMYNLLNKPKYTFVGCNEIPRFKNFHSLSNSFFGATKKNPILKRALLKSTLNKIDFHDPRVDYQTGPGFLRRNILDNDNIFIFPTKYFYPFVERYSPTQKNPPYRKSKKNKCHSDKRRRGYTKLNNKKGYIKYPCNKYPESFAIKRWDLGKSWLNFLEYNIIE